MGQFTAKLTEAECAAILRRSRAGESQRALGRAFGVDHRTIARTIRREEVREAQAAADRKLASNAARRARDRAVTHGEPLPPEHSLSPDEVAPAEPDFIPVQVHPARRRVPAPASKPKNPIGPRVLTAQPSGDPLPAPYREAVVIEDWNIERLGAVRRKWLLSVAAAEERLLEDPRYPTGSGRYSQAGTRDFIFLGSVEEYLAFPRLAWNMGYEIPDGIGGRIIVSDGRDPNEETEGDWITSRRIAQREEQARDRTRHHLIRADAGTIVSTVAGGLDHAESRAAAHSRHLGVEITVQPEER